MVCVDAEEGKIWGGINSVEDDGGALKNLWGPLPWVVNNKRGARREPEKRGGSTQEKGQGLSGVGTRNKGWVVAEFKEQFAPSTNEESLSEEGKKETLCVWHHAGAKDQNYI